MGNLEKFLNSSLIDTLCEARQDDFESLYINSQIKKGNKNIYNEYSDAEQELLNEINKYVSKSDALKNIRAKFNNYERYIYKDFDSILKRIYRLGVVDGYCLKKELNEIIEKEK